MKNKDNVKQIDGNKEEEKDKKDTRRILRLEARVTEDEYAKAAELAQSCGLTELKKSLEKVNNIIEKVM